MGQETETFKKSSTSTSIGADAVIIYLHLPPQMAANLLNNSLSYSSCL